MTIVIKATEQNFQTPVFQLISQSKIDVGSWSSVWEKSNLEWKMKHVKCRQQHVEGFTLSDQWSSHIGVLSFSGVFKNYFWIH